MYTLNNLEIIQRKFPQSFNILELCINFRLNSEHSYNKIQTIFGKRFFTAKSSTVYEEYIHYQLQSRVEILVEELNSRFEKVEIEKFFIESRSNKELKEIIESTLELLMKKYLKLSLDIVNYFEIDEICLRVNRNIEKIEKRWEDIS